MNDRPVFKLKVVQEQIAFKERTHIDSLVDQVDEVVLKQKREGVVVLVLDHVLDHFV